jgi:hypothetical protein
MALQSAGTNVTMSMKDINVELGENATDTLDMNTAAGQFTGLLDDNTISMDEFYGLTFSAGSGTYGSRNSHTFRFLDDDGTNRGYSDGELVAAAENDDTHLPGDFTILGQSDFVDDYINDDLTNGDTIFANSTGTTLTNLRPGGDFPSQTTFMLDTTADKIFQVDSDADISNIKSRTPATPTISETSKDANSITISIVGDTTVTRQYAPFKAGSELTNILPQLSGSIGNDSVTTSYTYSGLAASTSFALKVRGENLHANGSDSNTLTITTDDDTTAWSNLSGDPQNMLGADGGTEVSNAASIDLANGSGNTVITMGTSGGIVGTLQIAYSTSGDPGASGTANGGSGFGSSGSHRTIAEGTYSSGTLHFRTKFVHVSSKDGTGAYTVTFTNNSVADGNFNGSLTFGL